jgi:hypothetical protein
LQPPEIGRKSRSRVSPLLPIVVVTQCLAVLLPLQQAIAARIAASFRPEEYGPGMHKVSHTEANERRTDVLKSHLSKPFRSLNVLGFNGELSAFAGGM